MSRPEASAAFFCSSAIETRVLSIELSRSSRRAICGRRRGYQAQECAEREIIGLTFWMSAVEKSVEAIQPTTAELENVRDRVLVAGSLGRVLWGVGKALISAAARPPSITR